MCCRHHTYVTKVDVVDTRGEELHLGAVGVFTEEHTVHAVAFRLDVERQRLGLTLDVADDVEVDVLVARRAEREADGLTGLRRDPATERLSRQTAAVVGHEERLFLEAELNWNDFCVHQLHCFRRLLTYKHHNTFKDAR